MHSDTKVVDPENQLHYLHTLVFDHQNLSITDKYEWYQEMDISTIQESYIVRDSSYYKKFKEYHCQVDSLQIVLESDDMGWAGPVKAKIYFIYQNEDIQEAFCSDDSGLK